MRIFLIECADHDIIEKVVNFRKIKEDFA